MKVTSQFWIWSLVILLLGFLVVPELADWWYHYQLDSRISREKQKVSELVQAGDRGYDDLVRLVLSLWFGNVPPALKGILAQEKRDRVADLCAIYVACGQNRHHKEAIARVLGQLGDPRASTVLIKDLESVWQELAASSKTSSLVAAEVTRLISNAEGRMMNEEKAATDFARLVSFLHSAFFLLHCAFRVSPLTSAAASLTGSRLGRVGLAGPPSFSSGFRPSPGAIHPSNPAMCP